MLGEFFAISAAVSWAIGVILFKKSGDSFSPVGLNLFKNAVGIVLFIPTIYLAGETLVPDQPLRSWMMLAVSGILGITIADTLFFMALKRLGAGLTAVVDTSYAPLMLYMSWGFLGDPMGPEILIGAALIAGGMVLGSITKLPPSMKRKDLFVGACLGIGGISIMGLSIVIIKDILDQSPHIWATFVRTFSAEVGLMVVFLVRKRRKQLLYELKPSKQWKFAIPGAFFGTYLAMIAWIGGMKYTDVSIAALLNQLSTVFIFALATFVLKEPLTTRKGIAILWAFSGAILILLRH